MTENTKALDALAERINTGHRAYLAAARKALEHALAAGASLQEAKDGLPHGEWLPWLQANCPAVSERSAQRYLRLAQNRSFLGGESATVADRNQDQEARAGSGAMAGGYYRMARGWLDHPVLQGEPYDRRSAWAWLIEEALWQDRRCDTAGRIIELKRGQISHSTRSMAKAWGWSEARVRRFLTRLKTDAMIDAPSDAPSDAGRSLITIGNYERYQSVAAEGGAAKETASDASSDAARDQLEAGAS